MKKTFPLFAILFLAMTTSLFSQTLVSQNKNLLQGLKDPQTLKDIDKINSTENFLQTASILFPFNPIFVFENKKFYIGLTKEFSIGKFPYGRLAFEYSLIFRETHVNHLRFSYNYDIPLESGDLAAFLISIGIGYFTDFDKQGVFPQASFNLMIPVADDIGVIVYIKFRNTIMSKKSQSDIFDISLGLATSFYF